MIILTNQDIAALGTECDSNGAGEDIDTTSPVWNEDNKSHHIRLRTMRHDLQSKTRFPCGWRNDDARRDGASQFFGILSNKSRKHRKMSGRRIVPLLDRILVQRVKAAEVSIALLCWG